MICGDTNPGGATELIKAVVGKSLSGLVKMFSNMEEWAEETFDWMIDKQTDVFFMLNEK